jgi:hypothetical protein
LTTEKFYETDSRVGVHTTTCDLLTNHYFGKRGVITKLVVTLWARMLYQGILKGEVSLYQ